MFSSINATLQLNYQTNTSEREILVIFKPTSFFKVTKEFVPFQLFYFHLIVEYMFKGDENNRCENNKK